MKKTLYVAIFAVFLSPFMANATVDVNIKYREPQKLSVWWNPSTWFRKLEKVELIEIKTPVSTTTVLQPTATTSKEVVKPVVKTPVKKVTPAKPIEKPIIIESKPVIEVKTEPKPVIDEAERARQAQIQMGLERDKRMADFAAFQTEQKRIEEERNLKLQREADALKIKEIQQAMLDLKRKYIADEEKIFSNTSLSEHNKNKFKAELLRVYLLELDKLQLQLQEMMFKQ